MLRNLFALLACFSVFASASQKEPSGWRSLAAGKDPVSLPVALKGKPLIGASEVHDTSLKFADWLQVYRYSWKGDAAKFAKAVASDWKEKLEIDGKRFVVERLLKSGPVARQGLIIVAGRAIKDASSMHGVKFVEDPAWIRVSYNEELRRNKHGKN